MQQQSDDRYAVLLKEVSEWDRNDYVALLDAVTERVVEDIRADICLRVHRKVKTKPWLLYQDGLPVHFTSNGRSKPTAMKCDHCDAKLTSNKYAAHLEKCMQKKARRSSNSSSTPSASSSSSSSSSSLSVVGLQPSRLLVYDYTNRVLLKETGGGAAAVTQNVGMAKDGAVGKGRKRSSTSSGRRLSDFWVDALPDPLPTHSTHGAYPYLFTTEELETVNANAGRVPSDAAVSEMLSRICGCIVSEQTRKMCVYKMSCKHHDPQRQTDVRARIGSGELHIRFRKVRASKKKKLLLEESKKSNQDASFATSV